MKNLIILSAIFILGSFTSPNCGKLQVSASLQGDNLIVNVENNDFVDLKLHITVFDSEGNKLAKQKEFIKVDQKSEFKIESKEGFSNFPLKVHVKGNGRDKAQFITTHGTTQVKN